MPQAVTLNTGADAPAVGASSPSPSPRGKAWETVLHTIEAQLLDGRLTPGDHLPPERTLASALSVGRSSVREAVRVLEVLGLVRTATGSGPAAGAIIVATPRGGMSALLRLQVAAQGFPVVDIVHTRLLLETAVVGDLADRVASTPAEVVHSQKSVAMGGAKRHFSANESTHPGAAGLGLADARALLAAMEPTTLTPDEFLALDAQFHLTLAEAAGNTVVTAMMAGLRDSIESYVTAGVPDLPDWQRTVTRLRAEHHSILTAIETADAALARRRIHDHISGYYAEMTMT